MASTMGKHNWQFFTHPKQFCIPVILKPHQNLPHFLIFHKLLLFRLDFLFLKHTLFFFQEHLCQTPNALPSQSNFLLTWGLILNLTCRTANAAVLEMFAAGSGVLTCHFSNYFEFLKYFSKRCQPVSLSEL